MVDEAIAEMVERHLGVMVNGGVPRRRNARAVIEREDRTRDLGSVAASCGGNSRYKQQNDGHKRDGHKRQNTDQHIAH